MAMLLLPYRIGSGSFQYSNCYHSVCAAQLLTKLALAETHLNFLKSLCLCNPDILFRAAHCKKQNLSNRNVEFLSVM